MSRVLRENGLSIALFGLFAIFLLGQTIAGLHAYNQREKMQGRSPVPYLSYLATGHNAEAVFENWESEFLQMAAMVLMTVFLVQKGSAVSRELKKGAEGNGRGDYSTNGGNTNWRRFLYDNSLSIAFILLYVMSFLLHAWGGCAAYNSEQSEHGRAAVSVLEFMGTSEFWFQSFQNYQSEFLALWSMVVLSIFLRQKHSPQSKPLEAELAATGA